MNNHGINVSEQATSVSTPAVAESGIPFVVGIAPVQAAENAPAAGMPVLCTSWEEAIAALGYSDNWKNYTICEFMYSHLKLFERQPVIFCNVLDVTKAKENIAAADFAVVDHKAVLPIEAINDQNLVVQNAEGSALTLNTDYATYYSGEKLVVELLKDGSAYDVGNVKIAYDKVNPSAVTATDIASAFENVELCLTKLGIIPDLLCAPGFSSDAAIAAAMTAKAGNISGHFKAKPLIDIDCSAMGATRYSDVATIKAKNNFTDKDQIICWPMVKRGNKIFHMSTHLAGGTATVDTNNEGCPYESPSNKPLQCDGLCLADGTEVNLTLTQANELNSNGVVTALNFVNGWCAWGNHTACYPANADVKDNLISVNRMFGWVGNTIIKTFWSKLDQPMNRRLIDSVLNTATIWLNGLVGKGYLLGARVVFNESENPLEKLSAGIIKFHLYLTPPGPAQEFDFVLEYDANYFISAMQN